MSNVSKKSREEYVQVVFAAIAHRYDLLNTLLSFNRDRYWRQFAVRQTGLVAGDTVLDVCCGTGMMAMAEAELVGATGSVTGIDFSPPMLAVAAQRIAKTPHCGIIKLLEGNAMALPFADNTFDCATIAFRVAQRP